MGALSAMGPHLSPPIATLFFGPLLPSTRTHLRHRHQLSSPSMDGSALWSGPTAVKRDVAAVRSSSTVFLSVARPRRAFRRCGRASTQRGVVYGPTDRHAPRR